MAQVTLKGQPHRTFGDNVPYGNSTTLAFTLKTNSDGAAINSDSKEKLSAGDVVVLGVLPAGMRLDDASVLVKTGMTATITGSLGFAYEDGEDESDAPQAADYFGSGLDIATAGRVRATGNGFVTLPKPALLILTTAVADNVKASEINVLVNGVNTGVL